jgi:hypothetical protein
VLQHKIQYIDQDTVENYSASSSNLVTTTKETSLTVPQPDIAALVMILASTFKHTKETCDSQNNSMA